MTTLQVLTLLLNKFRVSLSTSSIVPMMVVCGFVGTGWGKAGGSCLRHLGRRSSKVSSDELESLGFEIETDRELEGEGLGTRVCGTGVWLLPGIAFFLSCLKKPRSDFLSLLQVENGPSEFALYVVHESGGKCLPLPLEHKNKRPSVWQAHQPCSFSEGHAGL